MTVLKSLYSLSNDNKEHFDYALANNLKFELIPEDPRKPYHFQYRGAEHKIVIPIPYNQGRYSTYIYDDPFEAELRLSVLHELQHAQMSLMNSDKNCRPDLQNQKIRDNQLKEMYLSKPRNADEILKEVGIGQNYILNDVAKLLPSDGSYVDYTKKYTLAECQSFFKNKSIPDSIEAEKELAYLQYLLQNYYPNRQTALLDIDDPYTRDAIASLKRVLPHAYPAKDFTFYIDSLDERHQKIYASGYFVPDPRDKVRALVEHIHYHRGRKLKFYEKVKGTTFTKENRAAEIDAFTFELGDVATHKKLYPELTELHKETRAKSKCQL